MAAFSDVKGDFPRNIGGSEYLGRYAVSLAGHDTGKIYLVVGVVCKGPAAAPQAFLLADGRSRKASAPKLKKRMHVCVLKSGDEQLAAALAEGGGVTDAQLVHSLRCFKAQSTLC